MRCSRQKKRGLKKSENHNRIEIRLLIRPFTVKVNCRIRGLASIRKDLGTENTPFLVSSYSIGERIRKGSGENLKSRNSCFCQSGGVLFLPILRGPNFANPEGSCFCPSGRALFSSIRRGPILPIRRGSVFANPEGSCFCQSEGVPFCQSGGVPVLPIRRGPVFAKPEGYCLVKT